MNAAELAARFGARQTRPGEWRCRCPYHRGKSATSLSIREAPDGTPLIFCFAGCRPSDVLAEIGLTWRTVLSGSTPAAPDPTDPRHTILATPETLDAAILWALAQTVVSPEIDVRIGMEDF